MGSMQNSERSRDGEITRCRQQCLAIWSKMKYCVAFGCANTDVKPECREKKISFHRFPIQKESLMKQWYAKISRKDFVATEHSRLCSDHFDETAFVYQPFTGRRQLRPDAVPTVFIHRKTAVKRKRTSYQVGQAVSLHATENHEEEQAPSEQQKDASCQTDVNDVSKLLAILQEKDKKISLLEFRNKALEFTFYSLSSKGDDLFRSVTGYSVKYFLIIFNLFKIEESMTSTTGAPKTLTAINVFLLTMVRLRHALSESFLAVLFHVNQSTVSRYFSNCLEIMYLKSSNTDIWPTKQQVQAFMPPTFYDHFPSCRVIIDCTEFFIQQPTNPTEQQSSFSNYKNHNTVKSLIGIAPSGAVSYISDLYNGAISDRELTIRSGLIEKLEAGDCVLADRGFTVLNDILESKGITLFTPNFLKDKVQFPVNERCENKRISSHRCHVERAISRIKNSQILNGEIPYSMLQSLNEIHYVCAFLSNFSEQPLIQFV